MFIIKILERIMAVFGAIVLFICVLITTIAIIGAYEEDKAQTAPDNMVVTINFDSPIVEDGQGFGFDIGRLLSDDAGTQPLWDIVAALDRAATDPRVKGVVARIGYTVPNMAQIQEIRDAMARFRQSGKFSYIFSTGYGDFGGGSAPYYLATAFENIWLQPVGTLGITGLGMESPFGKTALGNWGITTDFMRREDHKSVMEPFTNDAFSPAVHADMAAMLDSLATQHRAGLSARLGVEATRAQEIIAGGPYTAGEAFSLGLITRVGYDDELFDIAGLLATDVGGKKRKSVHPTWVDARDYLAFAPRKKLSKAAGTVAVIYASGMITDSPEVGPADISGEEVMSTERVTTAFSDAADDEDIDAILFRVDSPGGSPSASETIRRAMVKAQRAGKPVFVSMGGVAASGGYWISMNADHIVAEPATITGSIGVIAGKFVLGGLWEKLGVKWDGLTTADNARMMSSVTPFSEHARARMNKLLDDTYGTFTAHVASARKIPADKIQDIAGGRIWTGEQAMKVGLVDELGGMATTVAAIKEHLELNASDRLELRQFPAPETAEDFVLKMVMRLWQSGVVFQRTTSMLSFLSGEIAQITGQPFAGETGRNSGSISAILPPEYRYVK